MRLISLSQLVFLIPSLSVCQMGFMYLIYLREWWTTETKMLRHVLQAEALLKIQAHTCGLQEHR